MEASAPEFQWGRFDLGERGFKCKVEARETKDLGIVDVAECLMPLPVWAEDYARGEYRWKPYDRKRIVQYGFVGNDNDDVANKWVSLGVVEF